jgi:hypothetical protein
MGNKLSIAHIASEKDFPHFTLYKPKQNGGWEFDYVKLTAFFTTRGYFIYRTSIDKFFPIRIIDNIVKQVGKKELKDEILNFLLNIDECPEHIHQFALKDIAKAVNEEFLETLPAKQVEFRRDRKDAMQIYYQNCIVKITGKKITTHPYTELDGYIWESQILQRDYDIVYGPEMQSDFKKFAFNISNQDPDRYASVCSVIGFLIHNFKNPAYCPAIILNDEVISDHPEGGTGKGILIKAVEQFLTTVTIEGKTFNFDKGFVYQSVNSDTKLMSFQDVNKSFDFERLFSVLTDGITVEKKGLQAIHYPFNETPKIVITTNYAIRGVGNSHERRRFELEISQYYNKKRTPFDEFKKMMFIDWRQHEFLAFDSFIMECCQYYLNNGLVTQVLINLPEKRLMTETNYDFIEFMEGKELLTMAIADVYSDFVKEYPEYLKDKFFSKQKLSKWMRIYALYKGYSMPDKAYVYNSIRYYTFNKLQS